MTKADSKDRPGLIPRLNVLTNVFHSLGTHAGITRSIAEEQTIKIYKKNMTVLRLNPECLFLPICTYKTTHNHTQKQEQREHENTGLAL